jgi:hypothetical protein
MGLRAGETGQMRRTKRGGEAPGRSLATEGSVATAAGSIPTAVTTAAGGASGTAGAGVATEAADSIWQQVLMAFTTVVPEASGPWQHPSLEEAGAPGRAGPRWQKQSPAEAFINAKARTATPRVRSRGFMRRVLE